MIALRAISWKEYADQVTLVHHRHMGDVQLRHQPAQKIDAVFRLGGGRIGFHDDAARGLHELPAMRIQAAQKIRAG